MDYRDGESLFQAACTPDGQTRFGSPSESLRSAPTYSLPLSGPARYPRPVVRHPYDLIRGYYLNEPGTHDVAVLQVPTFELGTEIPSFVKTAVDFVERAVTDDKVKIIIDLSGNGGGDVTQGFNLFRIFYPDRPIYSATRFRATELIDLMGQVFSRAINARTGGVLDPPLIFQDAVTPDQQDPFTSWEQLYGPQEIMGAKMSSLYAVYNFSTASNRDDPISGYGGIPSDFLTQPFETENIVVVRLLCLLSSRAAWKLSDHEKIGDRRHLRVHLQHVRRAYEKARREEYRLRRTSPVRSHTGIRRCQGRPVLVTSSSSSIHLQRIRTCSKRVPSRLTHPDSRAARPV